jgi:excisionase family DNA binding protein
VGAAGFEPTTPGFGGETRTLVGGSNGTQAVGIVGARGDDGSGGEHGLAANRREFGAHLVPRSMVGAGLAHERLGELLTVQEVARTLRVCTATVYRLCERGEIAHLRVSNAIRVAADDLQAYLRGGQAGEGPRTGGLDDPR